MSDGQEMGGCLGHRRIARDRLELVDGCTGLGGREGTAAEGTLSNEAGPDEAAEADDGPGRSTGRCSDER